MSGRQIAMTCRCVSCGNGTAEYVITAELSYMLCDRCFTVEVLDIVERAL